MKYLSFFMKIRAGAAAGPPDGEDMRPSEQAAPSQCLRRVLHGIKVDKPSHVSAFTQRDGTQRTQHHLSVFVPTQISEEETGVVPQQEGVRERTCSSASQDASNA